MKLTLARLIGLWIGLSAWPLTAISSNTGGIFGPVVNEGHRSVQYRAGFDIDRHAFAQRLHYQRSTSPMLMWRGIVQTVKTAQSDTDFDFVQGEVYVDLGEDGDLWRHGLRLDLRIRDEDRPAQFGLNWAQQIQIADRWFVRLIGLSALQFGENSADGVFLETRASATYQSSERIAYALELFSAYGPSTDLSGWREQRQQLGPTASLGLGSGWQVDAGVLFGLTDPGSPDQTLRFWLTKRIP